MVADGICKIRLVEELSNTVPEVKPIALFIPTSSARDRDEKFTDVESILSEKENINIPELRSKLTNCSNDGLSKSAPRNDACKAFAKLRCGVGLLYSSKINPSLLERKHISVVVHIC